MTPEERQREVVIKLKILALHRLLVQKSVKFSTTFVSQKWHGILELEDQIAYLVFVLDAYKNVLKRIN